ncbi:MAG: cytidine deaminase [Micromonosporaceae bacterium]
MPSSSNDDALFSAEEHVTDDALFSAEEHVTDVDWLALRAQATSAMRRAYAPYSGFPVGAAGLVDDGRTVVGCNVENASYGMVLCAECGVVSALHAGGGGRLVALSCVDGKGEPLMPCGRCRQLLWEHGGAQCLIDAAGGPRRLVDLLPHAFGPADLARPPGAELPAWTRKWRGRGTVFVHPDVAGGQPVWTAYWERSNGFDGADEPAVRGILEEGPTWPAVGQAVAWGRARTPRVVVVDAAGELSWAGEGDPPAEVGSRWDRDD